MSNDRMRHSQKCLPSSKLPNRPPLFDKHRTPPVTPSLYNTPFFKASYRPPRSLKTTSSKPQGENRTRAPHEQRCGRRIRRRRSKRYPPERWWICGSVAPTCGSWPLWFSLQIWGITCCPNLPDVSPLQKGIPAFHGARWCQEGAPLLSCRSQWLCSFRLWSFQRETTCSTQSTRCETQHNTSLRWGLSETHN